jgi:hypothetical protein
MPRPKQMRRPDEKEVNLEDAELLADLEGIALSPEEQEKLDIAEMHLNQYGKLTAHERKILKKKMPTNPSNLVWL